MGGAHKITKKDWGKVEGMDIYLFRMENSQGAYVEISNYGATLVSIYTPDKKGTLGNVILGFPDLKGYLEDGCYIGSTVGRFANRIAGASFELDGQRFILEANDGRNSNHSGTSGFNSKVFHAEIKEDTLCLNLTSPDGEGGFPGNVQITVEYRWTDDYELEIRYFGQADQKTILNLTNHAYFDLSTGTGDVFNHELTIQSNKIIEAGADYIPTGKIIPAGKNAFLQRLIAAQINREDGLIEGINTCYVLENENVSSSLFAAELKDPGSGRVMKVYTSYPGIMLYTGDYLNSSETGHSGRAYKAFDGLCLECQYFPDSPNQVQFPSVVLNPEDEYRHYITLKFNT